MESATHRPIAEAFRARLNAATQMHVRNFIYSSFLRLFYSDFYNTFNYRCQFAPMVGAVRFELTTSCTRNKRATRLRYAPTQNGTYTMYEEGRKGNVDFGANGDRKHLPFPFLARSHYNCRVKRLWPVMILSIALLGGAG